MPRPAQAKILAQAVRAKGSQAAQRAAQVDSNPIIPGVQPMPKNTPGSVQPVLKSIP
jgi:hypothetical protein